MKTSITYKRVLSLVAMLLLVALPAMAFAAPELTATADKTSVTAGDTVVVTVTLAGKKLSAAEGEFSYDPSLLTFTEGDGGASDGRIALVSAEKDGASSLSARITFTAAGAGEAKVDFNITKALSYSGEDQGAATASVTVSIAAAPAAANEAKKGMSKGLKTTLIAVCAVLIVCIVVFFYMLTSGFFASHTTAATVGTHKLTPAMVNYFYKGAYSNMQNQYGDFMSYVIDSDTPLDEQVYDEESGETWADYFTDQGLINASNAYALYDAAKADGHTLSEDEQASIDSQISSLALYASYYGTNTSGYIAGVYGTGCNEKNFREYLEVVTLADSYATATQNGFTYTDEQIASEYAADPNSYDAVTYRQFLVSDAMFQTDSTDTEDNDAEAEAETLSDEELTALKEELASKMAADTQGDEQAFIDQAYENCLESAKETYAEDSATLKENQLYSSLSTDVADWLFDAGRAEGDTTYIATDSVYYVLYFVSRSTNDYQLPNVRHILFSVSDTTDETAMDEARTKAEDVLTEYEAGDKTAESFGELAKEYTSDSNGDEGGLYENIMPGQMVTEFNDWCFDADRKPGDTGIIETSYGVHVMYFDSFGKIYRDALVENALRSADYNAWYDATAGDGSYTTSAFGMKYTTK